RGAPASRRTSKATFPAHPDWWAFLYLLIFLPLAEAGMTPTPSPTPPGTPTAAPPAVLAFPADLTTPGRGLLALTAPGQDAYLLESVTGGESQARFSFIGLDAVESFEAGARAALVRPEGAEPLPG